MSTRGGGKRRRPSSRTIEKAHAPRPVTRPVVRPAAPMQMDPRILGKAIELAARSLIENPTLAPLVPGLNSASVPQNRQPGAAPAPDTPSRIEPGPGAGFFGAGQPPNLTTTDNVKGRTRDYQTNINLRFTPGEDQGVTFDELRALADGCTILRGAIETRKDQISSRRWTLQRIGSKKSAEQDPEAKELEAWLRYPQRLDNGDPEYDFEEWTRVWAEDSIVLDQAAIYTRPTLSGRPFSLDVIDGATILRRLNEDGRTPSPPSTAYQQKIKGAIAANFTTRELLLVVRNPRSNRLYGYSVVEQLMMIVNMAIRRDIVKLEHYTSGNIPPALIKVPKEWGPEQLEQIDKYWQTMLNGNLAAKNQVQFIPGGEGESVYFFKDAILKDQFDEWLARVIAWLMGISPQALLSTTKQGQATSEEMGKEAQDTGLDPWLNFRRRVMNRLIQMYLGHPNIEYIDLDREGRDNLDNAQADEIRVKNGLRSRDEIREEEGKGPIPGGDVYTVETGSGPVPLDMVATGAMMPAPAPAPVDGPGAEPKPDEISPAERAIQRAEKHSARANGKAVELEKKGRRRTKRSIRLRELHNPKHGDAEDRLKDRFASYLAASRPRVIKAALSEFAALSEADRAMPSGDLQKAIGSRLRKAEEEGGDGPGTDALIEVVEAELRLVGLAQARAAVASLELADSSGLVNKTNEIVSRYAHERAAELVGKQWRDGELVDNPNPRMAITDTTRDRIQAMIAKAVDDGWTSEQLQGELSDNFLFSEYRARSIAETELAFVNGYANMQTYRESGAVAGKRWLLSNVHGEGKPDECDENAAAGFIPLEQAFPSGDAIYPAHPACACDVEVDLHPEEGGDEAGDE